MSAPGDARGTGAEKRHRFGPEFIPLNISAPFIRRPVATTLLTIAIALAGMVAGGVMVFVWKYGVKPLGGVWNIYELLPAFIVASAAIVVVSLLTAPPAQEICEEFDSLK